MTNPITRRIFLETGAAAIAAELLGRHYTMQVNQLINIDTSRHDSLTRQIEYQVNLIDGEVMGLVK